MHQTTNVIPENLNYHHYSKEKYDSDIIRAIPGHNEIHEKISDIILKYSSKNTVNRILDLGIGTGITSEKIMKIFPDSELVGIDFSETMLNGAKKRLVGFKVNYILGDYSEVEFSKSFDIIVSVISIHHQNNNGKKKLFNKIYKSLQKNGIFIFGDLATYRDKKEAAYNHAKHFASLVENSVDEDTLRDWAYHHIYLNNLAPIEDQIEWLKKVGFSSVDTIFTKFNTFLILAKKGNSNFSKLK